MIDIEATLEQHLAQRASTVEVRPDIDAVIQTRRHLPLSRVQPRSRSRFAVVGLIAALIVLLAIGIVVIERRPSDPGRPVDQPVTPPTSAPVTAPAAGSDPHFAAFSECDDERLAGRFLCATVDVPVDRDDPSAGTIPIRVIGRPHTDLDAPEQEPFFATPGGPGSEGIENYAMWKLPDLLDDHRDIVAIDPRGTGRSGAIDCPDLQDGWNSRDELAGAIRACGAQLGDRSDRYGSANRAMDVDDVRRFMGYDTIVYHGQDYASVDVQAYAARFGEHLHAVVFDSGMPINDMLGSSFGTDMPSGMLDVVAATCASSRPCSASTDDARGAVEALVVGLGEAPVTGVATGSSDEQVVDQARIAHLLYDDQASLEVVEAALAYASGDEQPLIDLGARYPRWYPEGDGDPTAFSTGANFAGMCNDLATPYEPTDSVAVRREKLGAAVAALPDDTFAPWTKDQWDQYWMFDLCIDWPAPNHFEPVLPSGTTFPGIPALSLAGDWEATDALSARLIDIFPDVLIYTVPEVRGPTLQLGDCIAEFEVEFIESLAAPAEPPCPGAT